jgi:hypothetical protein
MVAHQDEGMKIALGLDESCEIAERSPLVAEAGASAHSGARFERMVLANGRRLVLKHLPPEGDWLTRVTGGASRTRLLWDSGILAEVAASVDHAIVAVVRSEAADVVVEGSIPEPSISPASAPLPNGVSSRRPAAGPGRSRRGRGLSAAGVVGQACARGPVDVVPM